MKVNRKVSSIIDNQSVSEGSRLHQLDVLEILHFVQNDNTHIYIKKALVSIHLQELKRVLEAGLEPAQPLLAKGF